MYKFIWSFFCFFGLCSPFTFAADVQMTSVTLMQPDSVYSERGISVKDLSNTILQAVEKTKNAWEKETLPPGAGFIVLALRNDGQINAWLDMRPEITEAVENDTIQQIRQIQGPQFTDGMAILAIQISVNGGKIESEEITLPMPKAWDKARYAFSEPVDIETLVRHVWPE